MANFSEVSQRSIIYTVYISGLQLPNTMISPIRPTGKVEQESRKTVSFLCVCVRVLMEAYSFSGHILQLSI